MKTTFLNYWAILLMAAFMGTGCSDDDDPVVNDLPEENEEYVIYELDALQYALTNLDEAGELKNRIYGVALNEMLPDYISIGVDSLQEAVDMFRLWFADTTEISTDGLTATFTTRKGSAVLTPTDGENGIIGRVTFDVPGLKYVSQIEFILNSAWPENASKPSDYKFGNSYEFEVWTWAYESVHMEDWLYKIVYGGLYPREDKIKYCCIREYKNAQPALLVAITPYTKPVSWASIEYYGGNIPRREQAEEIQRILAKNWEMYKALFKQMYGVEVLTDTDIYTIYSGSGNHKIRAIRLKDGYVHTNTYTKPPRRGVLLRKYIQ